SFSARTDVAAWMPVVSRMRSHRRSSASKPSQLDEVPFQAITSSLAWDSNSAATRIAVSSNCASAPCVSAISVMRKRPKCAVTSGRPASIAAVIGSRAVFDDGVSIPRRVMVVMDRNSHLLQTAERAGLRDGPHRTCIGPSEPDANTEDCHGGVGHACIPRGVLFSRKIGHWTRFASLPILDAKQSEEAVMTEAPVVRLEKEGDVGVIIVNYPPVNALGPGVAEGIIDCLAQANADAAIKAVVLMGDGRSFTAGADIRGFGTNRKRLPLGERTYDRMDLS